MSDWWFRIRFWKGVVLARLPVGPWDAERWFGPGDVYVNLIKMIAIRWRCLR